jgi:hypothetical protein
MRALVLLIGLLSACIAWAQVRSIPIPPEARRAEMSHVRENIVEVNRQELQLSPGAQIRDPLNRIIVPASLPPASVVRYQLDAAGLVHRVWILTAEEADRPE